MIDAELEQRRYAAEENTVRQAIALGYRLQVVCLACERRVMVDLRNLEQQGYGDRVLRKLSFSCTPCKRRGRKMSIHPAGKDTFIRVLFVGEKG
jgi:hypothetical protein